MTLEGRYDTPPIDRIRAAERLRSANRSREVDDAAWAYGALPESRSALRVLIECLMANNHEEDADALIARGLLLRPADPALTLLRARSLLARRRLDEASREVRLALRRRPGHAPTIVTAARIERARGNARQALVLLRYGRGEHPGHSELRSLLAVTLLDLGRTEEARAIAERLDPDPLLNARLAIAEGRHLDAIELLENADETPEITCLLLQRLVDAGRYQHLRTHLTAHHCSPSAVVRLECARSWIALGEYGTAIRLTYSIRETPRLENAALEILATAATLAERPRLARRALTRRSRHAGEDRRRLAALWCHGTGSRLIARQMRPRKAGSDRNQQILPTLLANAERILAATSEPSPPGLRPLSPEAIADQQKHCRLALARHTDSNHRRAA